ncbi:MAG: tail fiber domain-containing protein [Chitinophagaceae bacterium]|nr:tail fiber domain-containing protein [Chitinophagaceae bacterium]
MMLADRINSTVIGSRAYTNTNNSMVLGSINGVNGATADVKVGIGVTDPTEKLEIGNGRLRFRGNAPGGNAHGITWTNNAGTIDRAFIGMETDNFFGIYNFGFPPGWNVRLHNTTGEMGINKQPGTTTSESRLQVKQRSAGANYGIGIETAINTNRWDIFLDNNTTPDYNFSYNGNLRGYIQNATGNYIVVSDKRFKKDISSFSNSLAKINQLETYQYHYLDNSTIDPFSIGFMAQDVQKLFPDAVSEKVMDDGKKRLGVNYQYFTVLAIKGLQEQQSNIDAQNKKIEVLENQLAELKKLVEQQIKK